MKYTWLDLMINGQKKIRTHNLLGTGLEKQKRQNRMKRNPYPNQQLRTRLIHRMEKIILST
jgi:hypothetical protein